MVGRQGLYTGLRQGTDYVDRNLPTIRKGVGLLVDHGATSITRHTSKTFKLRLLGYVNGDVTIYKLRKR